MLHPIVGLSSWWGMVLKAEQRRGREWSESELESESESQRQPDRQARKEKRGL